MSSNEISMDRTSIGWFWHRWATPQEGTVCKIQTIKGRELMAEKYQGRWRDEDGVFVEDVYQWQLRKWNPPKDWHLKDLI